MEAGGKWLGQDMTSKGIHAGFENGLVLLRVIIKIPSLTPNRCGSLSHQGRSLSTPTQHHAPTIRSSTEVIYIGPLSLDFGLQNSVPKKMLFSATYLSYVLIATENWSTCIHLSARRWKHGQNFVWGIGYNFMATRIQTTWHILLVTFWKHVKSVHAHLLLSDSCQ